MSRTTGSDGVKTKAAIETATINLIARHGFEAMTMRQLGDTVGVGAAAVYRYYPNKQALLVGIMRDYYAGLMDAWLKIHPGNIASPPEMLSAFIECQISFSVENRLTTQIANLEIRSLEPEYMSEIIKMRDERDRTLRTILRAGEQNGSFDIPDIGLAALSITQMINAIVIWYRPGSQMTLQSAIAAYDTMIKRLVGCK